MNKLKDADLHCKINPELKELLREDADLNNRDMTGQLVHILEERYYQSTRKGKTNV